MQLRRSGVARGGNPELITEGVTGLMFEPGDSAALAGLLKQLLASEDLRVNLGVAAAEFVRHNFCLERSAARMGEIYAEFLDRETAVRA